MEVADYYDRLVGKYSGDSVKACGWLSKSTQELRYEILSLVGDLRGSSLLDVGCGLGGFWQYLQDEDLPCHYTGIDVSRAMVKAAREHHPGVTFIASDWREYSVSDPLDFLVASGALSFHYEPVDNLFVVRAFLDYFFPMIRKGMAFNLLSTKAPNEYRSDRSRFRYFVPEEVLALCLDYTPYVSLRHDYLPNDFTVFLHK
ncbi:MAG: class I SAM-dependent methyltransferase [bacterium]|nr:class I SAM-dependent methyltransferase [bacterium]